MSLLVRALAGVLRSARRLFTDATMGVILVGVLLSIRQGRGPRSIVEAWRKLAMLTLAGAGVEAARRLEG